MQINCKIGGFLFLHDCTALHWWVRHAKECPPRISSWLAKLRPKVAGMISSDRTSLVHVPVRPHLHPVGTLELDIRQLAVGPPAANDLSSLSRQRKRAREREGVGSITTHQWIGGKWCHEKLQLIGLGMSHHDLILEVLCIDTVEQFLAFIFRERPKGPKGPSLYWFLFFYCQMLFPQCWDATHTNTAEHIHTHPQSIRWCFQFNQVYC